MRLAEFIIDTYYVVHYSDARPKVKAMILLLNDEKNVMTKLYFVANEVDIAGTFIADERDNSAAYYHIRRFREVIDILRNERPLTSRAKRTISEPGFVGIHTDTELIGEGEL